MSEDQYSVKVQDPEADVMDRLNDVKTAYGLMIAAVERDMMAARVQEETKQALVAAERAVRDAQNALTRALRVAYPDSVDKVDCRTLAGRPVEVSAQEAKVEETAADPAADLISPPSVAIAPESVVEVKE